MCNNEKDVILIIDDDSRNIFALELLLKSRRIKYVSALSAKEGLIILRSNPHIALIFMDMMMPEMDGYEAIIIIQSSKMYSHIPIVAITAQAMDGDREKCIAVGAKDYITKPINLEILMNVITKWM